MASDGGLEVVFATRTGRVAAFDDHVGAGTVRDDEDGLLRPFHCTAIADGSRTISEGLWVTYEVVPGPTGIEASRLRRRT